MKKEPPDVLVLPNWEYVPNERVKQWFDLLEWAFINKDTYLYNRASEKIKALLI